jgi:protein arginine kinase
VSEAGGVHRRGLDWLEPEGEDFEIVLSTRVRLARNLQGFPFAVRAETEDRARVLDRVSEVMDSGEILDSPGIWKMTDLDAGQRALLRERHLVSRELTGSDGEAPEGAALALDGRSSLGMMINEEDHLRLQTLRNGLQLEGAWREVDALDDRIGARVPYAFHHDFGFLTSCPTNVGTGLRASVLVHLPGLVLTKEIQKVLEGISQVGLTYRGLYGEGSEVVGNFFQVSNQTTLGKSEEDLVDHLGKIVGQVIQYEKRARSVLLREASSVLEDKVGRAYGILRHARQLPLDEMMNLMSGVRLGLTLKLLKTPRVETLNRIMISTQQAHLEEAAGRSLDEADANQLRASRVREALASDEEQGED